jgi:hypothetical protein
MRMELRCRTEGGWRECTRDFAFSVCRLTRGCGRIRSSCKVGPLPAVLRSGPYRFFFYSADVDEPASMWSGKTLRRNSGWIQYAWKGVAALAVWNFAAWNQFWAKTRCSC